MQVLNLSDQDDRYLKSLVYEMEALKDELSEFILENQVNRDLVLSYIEYLETER